MSLKEESFKKNLYIDSQYLPLLNVPDTINGKYIFFNEIWLLVIKNLFNLTLDQDVVNESKWFLKLRHNSFIDAS